MKVTKRQLKNIIKEELKETLHEGAYDRITAKMLGRLAQWKKTKGLSGAYATAKKIERIINTHRQEMEQDFSRMDIRDAPAAQEVLTVMREIQNAATQYLSTAEAPTAAAATDSGNKFGTPMQAVDSN